MATSSNAREQADFALGGGEMARRIAEFDWSSTPLGPIESWPPGLRTVVRLVLANRFPHLLWWGPSYIQIYNDAYRPIPGAKHPDRVLGRPASECWSEIWDIIGPLIDRPYHGGPPTWDDDILLEIDRHGFLEESHFTIAYSPVPDEGEPGGIGGVLATVQEITEKVIGERRVRVLRDLGVGLVEAKSAEETCAIAARMLARHARDLPFVLFYLTDPEGRAARLAGAAGVAAGEPASPETIRLVDAQESLWPLAEARSSGAMQVVEGLPERLRAVPPGPWSAPPRRAAVVPLPSSKPYEPAGFLVAGLSVRLDFDERYRDFLELLKTQIASSISNARAYEEERKRAEALAALDRAKTDFFSNVSHEFRTPLTLMLGPVEDLLEPNATELSASAREQLELVHRNSLRLLKLVNTMLDFSRIEAGRIQAQYEPVDLAAYTAELASVFRSAIERAGLRLVVDCPPLAAPDPAYVDRGMWEKIVLNLLNNAFKFTLQGEIEVRLEAAEGEARLSVRDTGVGIPAHELPHMFERFHRIRGVRGRTHEGTGIGLALVRELARLHGGDARVESVLDEGSRFTVTIPLGRAHLEAIHVPSTPAPASTPIGCEAFVEEALRWIAADGSAPEAGQRSGRPTPVSARASVLWADDNTDMREYVRRLLSERFDVEAVPDGEAALRAARARRPDIVLADVMMPRLDGFGLLRELRADPALAQVPVILLSARAGEEARIEGVDAGADDYLIKPFGARELLARVDAHVRLDRRRRQAEEALRASEQELLRQRSALEDLNRTLEERVVERSARLRAMAAELAQTEQRERARLAQILHDHLQQLLVAAKLKLGAVLDAATGERLGQELLGIRAVLDESIEASRSLAVELSPPVLNQQGLAAALEWLARFMHERHALEVELVVDRTGEPDNPDIRFLLFQAVRELLLNVVKHAGVDRARLVMRRGVDGRLEIEVRDEGAGFDPAAPGPVTGFGLFSVEQRLAAIGGTLRVETARAAGTTVTLGVPHASSERAPAALVVENPADRRIRVLLADDHTFVRQGLVELLGSEPDILVVGEAANGMEALELALRLEPQIVVMDVSMPRLDGIETTRRIKSRLPRIRVVALSMHEEASIATEMRQAGADVYLTKDRALDQLAAAIRESMGRPAAAD